MFKSLALLSVLAVLPLANAQSADPNTQDQSQQPAPIVRGNQQYGQQGNQQYSQLQQRRFRQQDQIVESQPVAGVWLRSESTSVLKTISATPERTEIELDRGRLNVTVHQPAQHSAILIDLPGGQTSLFKDGLYTFNADTNTVRVLRGEAAAYPGPIADNANEKAIKVKEDHQLALVAAPNSNHGEFKSVESYPYELTADLLQSPNQGDRPSANGYFGDYPYYGGYPYYAGGWGYPGYFGYGYPFAYGVGFGYYGGFHGGYGIRGGFRR